MCKNASPALIPAIRFSCDLREDRMRRFVEGIDRGQATLFPECLGDWIGVRKSMSALRRPNIAHAVAVARSFGQC